MRDKTKRMLRKNEKKNTFVAENTAGLYFHSNSSCFGGGL